MTLIIETKNDASAKVLASILRHMDFVKSVNWSEKTPSGKHSKNLKPLQNEDWTKTGRPATDEEIEQLCLEMEKETGGIESSKFFKRLQNKYKK